MNSVNLPSLLPEWERDALLYRCEREFNRRMFRFPWPYWQTRTKPQRVITGVGPVYAGWLIDLKDVMREASNG